MPRQPRYFLPDIPQHVVQRGIDRRSVFFCDADYKLYMDTLRDAATEHHCEIHAYVLMTNHVHLLITPRQPYSIPLLMQAIGRGYVQKLNKRRSRTGALWEGRYKASLIESDRYMLACYRYIELNPVRAAMVETPAKYPHSSYCCNAYGKADPIVVPHASYLAISDDPEERQQDYRALFTERLSPDFLETIRTTTNACRILGSEIFKDHIEAKIGRSVRPGRSGRPKRTNRHARFR